MSLAQKIEDYIVNQLPLGAEEIMVILSPQDHLEVKNEIIQYAHFKTGRVYSKIWSTNDLLKASVFSAAMFGKTIHFQVGRISCIGVMSKL